jgi:hypothetical protein
VTLLSPGITAPPFGTGLLVVNLGAAAARGGWRIAQSGDTNYITNATAQVALAGGSGYTIEFRAASGFVPPVNRLVQVPVGQTATINAQYLTPAEAWRQAAFGVNAGNALIAGEGADPDGDGLPNLLEYALGTDPNLANSQPTLLSTLTNFGGSDYLVLSFNRITNNTDLTYAVLVGNSLTELLTGSVYSATNFVGSNAHTTQIIRTGALVETIVVRDNTPVADATNRFIRLRVTSQ